MDFENQIPMAHHNFQQIVDDRDNLAKVSCYVSFVKAKITMLTLCP